MVKYKFVVGVYIDEKDTEKLMDFCKKNNFEFEDDFRMKELWQDYYRKETGFSGTIKFCHVTFRPVDKGGVKELFDTLEKVDFDMMIECEIS